MRRNEKAALEFAPREAAHESSPRQPRSLEEPDARRNSTAWRPRAPGDDLERVLAEDLVDTFLAAAPEIDVVQLGWKIAEEAQRREARP